METDSDPGVSRHDVPSSAAVEHLRLFRDHLSEASHHLWQAITVGCQSSCCKPATGSKLQRRLSLKSEQLESLAMEDADVTAASTSVQIPRNAVSCGWLTLNVIYPYDTWKQRWDMLIALLILYAAISVPVRIAFHADAHGWVWTFEMLSSIVFLIDLLKKKILQR